MSVTFWAPAAPCITVDGTCDLCEGTGRHYSDDTQTCFICEGSGISHTTTSTLPEINMSNMNAAAFLRQLIGEAEDSCGTWTAYELPTIETKLELMRMGTGVSLELEPVREGSVFIGGRDAAYIDRRVQDMLALVRAARKGNYSVSWG